jgi:hypothetical protein
MKFLSNIRLLLLAIWLGASVFFIGVAQAAFSVLPERELAGVVVGRSLSILNYGGMVIAAVLIISSLIGAGGLNQIWLWIERFLLLVLGVSAAAGQFVIGIWLASVRAQIGRPIDEVPADDPLKVQFDMLHEYSVWIMFVGMAAALIAFFLIANRKFGKPVVAKSDVFDFSKEFKT